ncbi:hypothetical protein [Halobacteriovorax marinus]|uniref:hypothetical protein n=1 Tax=Halobacteriovorax marinus TaxID=97084 RepID=UPI0012FE0840|nr:hypothetical protein [Halobacteriovorax marinus]
MSNQLRVLIVCFFMSSVGAYEWSRTSLSYLNGSSFQLGDNNRVEYSFEHAGGWKYGDNFFWFDVTDPQSSNDSSKTAIYGEWAPRLSFGKIFGFYSDERFFKDVLLSTTFEHGKSGVASRARLIGLGTDLNIPLFKFFQVNFYVRDNLDAEGVSFQSTIAYNLPLDISDRLSLYYSAYIDIVIGDEGNRSDNSYKESHWHTAQQLAYDVGKMYGYADIAYLGVEYQYWNRKYGIEGGPVENNLKLLIKWIF